MPAAPSISPGAPRERILCARGMTKRYRMGDVEVRAA